MNIKFKILLSGEVMQEIHWDLGVYRVGRSEFSDLVLADDSVSRSHLEIRITESSCYVTSMTAPGKMRVNSSVSETAELSDGDIIKIGRYELLAVFGEPMQTEAPRSDGEPRSPEEMGEGDVGAAGAEAADGAGGWNHEALAADAPRAEQSALAGPSRESVMKPFREGTVYPSEGTAALRAETMVESKPLVAKLVFTEGPKKGTELFLETYEVNLGRSKKADIYLDDDKLSRLHAKITRVGNGYRLFDLSSRHGTFVNGVRILEHPLMSFDVIELGQSKIQFLIHDMASAHLARQAGQAVVNLSETRTIQNDFVHASEIQAPVVLEHSMQPPAPAPGSKNNAAFPRFVAVPDAPSPRPGPSRLLIGVLAVGAIVVVWSAMNSTAPQVVSKPEVVTKAEIRLPPSIPREFTELSAENQRAVEGYYNSATAAAEKSNWDDALWNLKKLRELVPFYKQSNELGDTYAKRLKEKLLEETQKKAAQSEQADLANYLQEGKDYLAEENFDLAADAFTQAITLDPTNALAKQGLRAVEYKLKDIDQVPPERDAEKEKRKQVADLFLVALSALQIKSYQEAIDAGEKIRAIELKGDSKYLNEAKIIIDKAKLLQKEEFEPFLIQAKEKFAEGDYNASRDLCDEMLKRDQAYEEAKECSVRAKKQLNRLARDNYTYGYVLESMNRIEEAKQYWNRAKNFVRPGDPYYDKVMKKLDEYN